MNGKEVQPNPVYGYIQSMTKRDFLDIGLNQIAYIKKMQSMDNKEPIYEIYAADGEQLSVMDSYSTAIAAVRMHELFPVTLQ